MEFRRIPGLPPYVFTIIDGLKQEARRAGRDVVDLGFGNPDLPSPQIAVEKLSEAAHNSRNHRYSASRGIPKLRQAVAALYLRKFGVTLDPETEVLSTIGAKEGFSHLMWVLLQPGDAALVPSPSYPIHIWGPYFAGADARQVPVGTGEDYVANVMEAWELGWPKPRVVVLSFPHNPTTATIELADLQRLVDWARERDVVLVHDFAYADVAFDGWQPPSILQCEGAMECAVELYSMTKSFSMAGWRVAFLRRQQGGRRRARQAEVLPRLRHLPADPDRGHGHDERGGRLPGRGRTRSTSRGATPWSTGWPGSAGRSSGRAARCSSGRRSPSRTPRWARSSSRP